MSSIFDVIHVHWLLLSTEPLLIGRCYPALPIPCWTQLQSWLPPLCRLGLTVAVQRVFACHPVRPTRSHRGLKRCKRSRWTNTALTQVSADPVLIPLPSESTGQIRTIPPFLGTVGTGVMLEALTAHILLFKVTGRAWCAHTVMHGSYTALCHASDKGQRCYTPVVHTLNELN
jgi:hypothetical protein